MNEIGRHRDLTISVVFSIPSGHQKWLAGKSLINGGF